MQEKKQLNIYKAIPWILIVMCLVYIVLNNGVINKRSEKNIEESIESRHNVVVTNFVAYDFVRQIAKDKLDITFLMGPGVDSHSYEPKPSDVVKIVNSDLLIYIGGEMESWVSDLERAGHLEGLKKFQLMDTVELIKEEHDHDEEEEHYEGDGHDHNAEEESDHFDEHIWTSPSNAIKMVENIAIIISSLDKENTDFYLENAEKYAKEIETVRSEIWDIVNNSKHDTLLFGDKMPMKYFIKEYGLNVSSAFDGCSTETEPSMTKITSLIAEVNEKKLPAVLHIELNSGKVAKTIASETGAEVLEIQTLHNISKTDFDNGETYISLMRRNYEVLKKALN